MSGAHVMAVSGTQALASGGGSFPTEMAKLSDHVAAVKQLMRDVG